MSIQENIKGKVVVITDASSGLGEATARLLAQRGATLVLVARRKVFLDRLAAELRTGGASVAVFAADVSRKGDVDALASGAQREFGHIDVLVNNAANTPLSKLERPKLDDCGSMIDVNIKGVLYGIAAVLPGMRERGSGHVINLSSVAGWMVFAPIGTVYSATRFAVRAISEGLRAEARSGIRSTMISPGDADRELKHNTSTSATAIGLKAIYDAIQIPVDAVARTIAYAIEQPVHVDVKEIFVRTAFRDS